MFTDRVTLELCAGKGGNGVISWRREKFIPKGGPWGGDGGNGGSIILESDPQVYSLEAYRNRRQLRAQNGQQGATNNRKGKNGQNLLLKIPCGTLVKNAETGEVLYDVTEPHTKIEICLGGVGGKGNSRFKTPTNRAPNICTPGKPGQTIEVELELKLIADVGLVGFPNAGKSTLLTQATNVPVKIAPYPFTTLRPNLGYVMTREGGRILIADIPGIIAGAHQNRGLGLEFLRHIERTRLLLFVLDASNFEGRDPVEDYSVLRREIALYNPELLEKPSAVLLNKVDVEGANECVANFREMHPTVDTFEVSALTGQGVDAIVGFLKRKLSI